MLKVGLIGCGHIAAVHVRGWRKSGLAEITAVFDVNQEAAQRFAKRFGIAKVCRDVAELIASVGMIDDCSPPAVHVNNALATLAEGRDYLVEKPVVLSAADWDRVMEAQRKSGSRICVVHNLKFNPGVQTALRWVAEGRIGQVRSLDRLFLTDPSTDRMLRMNGHWSHKLPGGRWLETLPHELYLTFLFLGELEVQDVLALYSPNSTHPHTADEMVVTLRGDESVATYRYSAHSRANHRSMMVYGTDGTIRVEILSGSAVLYKPKTAHWTRGVSVETLTALRTLSRMVPDRVAASMAALRKENPHTRLITQFAQHLVGRGPAPVSLEEISYVVRMEEEIGKRAAARQPASNAPAA